ncbi:MAG: ABC transporter ATP-binding protein [Thaumarchaeota archaeon]|nr:ABC transporter ATP-binding protein [Nitrososphaerota archaeon]
MIETENLTKRFGGLTAVDNLTLKVNDGEVFGFLGPNGAGKTTTVRMLCCLISKTSGEARIGDYDIGRNEDALKIRKLIGLVPDNVGLYDDLSAYDNLDFYGKLYGCTEAQRKENIQRFLTMLGLWEKRDVMAGTFSKGMKQKLAIARALIHEPKLLFMDEPTANLDPESAKTVRDFILELKKEKRTIFLNTHNLDEAQRICDRIGILKTKLIATGTPQELERALSSGGGTRRTVVLLQEQATGAILAGVRKLPAVGGVTAEGNKLEVALSDPEKQNASVVEAIAKAGGHIQSVTIVGASLEDVYLKLVKEGGGS